MNETREKERKRLRVRETRIFLSLPFPLSYSFHSFVRIILYWWIKRMLRGTGMECVLCAVCVWWLEVGGEALLCGVCVWIQRFVSGSGGRSMS